MCDVLTMLVVCVLLFTAAGFGGEEHGAATKAVMGEYQLSLDAAAKKTNASKAESKSALQERLAKKKAQMEAKAVAAQQILNR